MRRPAPSLVGLLLALALAPCAPTVVGARQATPVATPELSANATVVAGGLDSPRGLRFGPDGTLYVAESGTGGTTSTQGQCEQVPPPVGPYTGGLTGRISKIDPRGQRATVLDGLPSSMTGPAIGNEVTSVADVAEVDGSLFYLLAGGGCSHGFPDVPNGVYRVGADGKPMLVADISAFVKAHPVAKPNPGDFEPDETPYSMVELGGRLYVVEPNHGEVDAVDPASGAITRVVDISASQGHIVPASIAAGPDGALYVGNLTPTPFPDGTAVILRITTDGQLTVFARGLTTVLGLAFDKQGTLYALESSTGNLQQPPFFVPGSGRVVRLTTGGAPEVVATGLTFPTAMTVGPDGSLYVSNFGFGQGPAAGRGEIVRIDLSAPQATGAGGGAPAGATPVA